MPKLIIFILFYFLVSCGGIDFVYKDNKKLVNPLFQKTEVNTSGINFNFINSYLPMFFGNNNEDVFKLIINITERKTKISVETNQAASNLKYELRFFYTLILKKDNCISYEKEITSNFSIIPKSSGYNYGTDASLEKKYELAISESLNQFVSSLSETNINNCL